MASDPAAKKPIQLSSADGQRVAFIHPDTGMVDVYRVEGGRRAALPFCSYDIRQVTRGRDVSSSMIITGGIDTDGFYLSQLHPDEKSAIPLKSNSCPYPESQLSAR